MDGQLSFFEDTSSSKFTIIEGGRNNPDNLIKCYKTSLQEVCNKTIEELFSGFNSIYAITFSYDISFIDKIMKQFDFGEILLGADFLVQKDSNINELLLAEICANAHEAGQSIKKYNGLVESMSNGNLFFRVPEFVLDHRKLYLLKADDGRTRVITSSANMTNKAWNGDHMETYQYDDSPYAYQEYFKDFETAWSNADDIPMSVVSSTRKDDLIEDNAILKKVKETGHTVVLHHEMDPIILDQIKYAIDHEKLNEQYKVALKGVAEKHKNSVIELNPKSIEKVKHNIRKSLQKVKINNVTESYPELTFDFSEKKVFLNGYEMDLNPSFNDVKSDIDELLKIFANFDDFVGNTEKLKETHFKLLNAVFSSPFNAAIRCNAALKGISTSSLPLFLLVSSESANCGKTFMMKALLKMMTGKDLEIYSKSSCKIDDIRKIQACCKGVPVLVDEIDNRYASNLKPVIKDIEDCEKYVRENQPMILFASNDIISPDEISRKRMVFLKLEGALPGNIDRNEFAGKGNAIMRRLGNGFYREYLKRMIEKVSDLIDYIITSDNIPDTWYPDIMKLSSETILAMLKDFGYEIPSYMRALTWHKDYSEQADYISQDAINEIIELYNRNRKAFQISQDSVTISLGDDDKKKAKSWINVLPPEMTSRNISGQYSIIVLDRNELEKRTGIKMRQSIFRRG